MKKVDESRRFFIKNSEGNYEAFTLNYTLFVDADGKLVDIKNQNGYSVEKTSDCWDHFTKKLTSNAKV
jgi:hypothetical protein